MNFQRVFRLLYLAPYQALNIAAVFIILIWFLLLGRNRIARSGMGDSAKKVTMLSYVSVLFDGRIRRAATSLADAGYEVLLIKPGDSDEGLDDDEINWHQSVTFLSTGLSGTTIYFPYVFDLKMFIAMVRNNAGVIHCHDANTCLMGIFAAAINRGVVVADLHEWLSEGGDWGSGWKEFHRLSGLKKIIYRMAEKLCLLYASQMVMSSPAHGAQMSKSLGVQKNINIVRNVPGIEQNTAPAISIKHDLNIADDDFLILYVGSLGPHRNIEEVIEALPHTPGVHFAIRGMGIDVMKPHWEASAKELGVEDCVHFLQPVPSDRIVAECYGADAGLYNFADVCLNFHYALGNKIFEYTMADIPILAGNFPEVEKVISEQQIGCVFIPDDPKSIADAINKMATNKEFYQTCRKNVLKARQELIDNPEWDKLVKLYKTFE